MQGDVEFAGGLHLDGRVQGQVRSVGTEPATLWISEQGTVEGGVDVPSVVINGTVIGDVHARERVAIGPQSRITGNVHYGTMEMTLGAQIDGKLIPMSGASAPPAPAGPAGRRAPRDGPGRAADRCGGLRRVPASGHRGWAGGRRRARLPARPQGLVFAARNPTLTLVRQGLRLVPDLKRATLRRTSGPAP